VYKLIEFKAQGAESGLGMERNIKISQKQLEIINVIYEMEEMKHSSTTCFEFIHDQFNNAIQIRDCSGAMIKEFIAYEFIVSMNNGALVVMNTK
jgi:hypothetical protein